MNEFLTAKRTIYPSVFRVLIGFILLFDLIFSFSFASIYFNPEYNSLLSSGKFFSIISANYKLFFVFYGLVLIGFILGVFKNLISFLVWICYLIWFNLNYSVTVWGDTILMYSLFYFVFADSFRYLSLSQSKNKYSFQSKLAVWSVILNIFMVYLNNAYYKILGTQWQDGVAVFYSFSHYDQFTESILYPLVTNSFFSGLIGYFIILQQLLFVPFVIWKKTRFPILILSTIIHLTMLIQFGLYKFELIIILHYGFLLNDEEIQRILSFFRIQKYFDGGRIKSS